MEIIWTKKASVFKENYEIYLSKIRELDFF